LAQTQAELEATKEQNITCDANTIMQLREQAQSLDLLSQELIERNTRLSKEVARLKVFEGTANNAAQVCEGRLSSRDLEWEEKLVRTRETFEDLLDEKNKQIAKLRKKLKKGEKKPQKTKKADPEKKAETFKSIPK